MSEIILPCYGGPLDGKFYKSSKVPLGYRTFNIRGRQVFLFGKIRVEKLDFNIVGRASKTLPSAFFDEGEER